MGTELHDETRHRADLQWTDLLLMETDIAAVGIVRLETIDEAITTFRVKALDTAWKATAARHRRTGSGTALARGCPPPFREG